MSIKPAFIKNSKGVSLLEAFIASIIFIIATAAIFNILESVRRPAVNNEQANQAALVLSDFLEDIRSKISQEDLALSQGAYASLLTPGINTLFQTGIYNIYYNVEQDGTTKIFKVDANIVWDDSF